MSSQKELKPIKHKHNCNCSRYNYQEWLVHVAPDCLFFNVQDVGSYQGQVFAVLIYKNKVGIMEDYYGSCSGCGAWGEDGEPQSQKDVLGNTKFFDSYEKAIEYTQEWDSYEKPDFKIFNNALKSAFKWINRGVVV